jgi:membrane peptidoglycan carboxypeptidase
MRRTRDTKPGVGPHGIRRGGARTEARVISGEALFLLGVGVFVLALVAGYAWSLDRQLRGGLLRQHTEGAARPDWVAIDALPGHVPAAFLVVVDPDFHERDKLVVETGHTTMSRDLVRQVHRLDAPMDGRARELLMAPLLEHHLSRRQLLELYLNRVYLGREGEWPVFGVLHAAREYYGKEPQELTLAEAATLAGMLLTPRIENPKTVPGAIGIRRQEVLREMLRLGMIDASQFQVATAEPLGFQLDAADAPMARPRRWSAEPPPLRLPPELRPQPDTVAPAAAS